MKQVTRLSVFIALLIVQCHVSNAQILYNSAFAYLTNTNVPTSSAAFVREYSANLSIICTYITPRLYPHLIMVDAVSGYTSPAIPLDQMQYVSDMMIDNGYVYFCGISNNTLSPYPSNACYGFVDINAFLSTTPSSYNVEYRYIDNLTTNTDVHLFRMQVYNDGTNDKLVILGSEKIPSSLILASFPFININSYISPTYISCLSQLFVLECTNPISPSPLTKILFVNSDNTNECVCDMTLTNSYVAIVGYDLMDNSKAYIHPCDKTNVLGTFNHRYEYTIPYPTIFNGYRCCALDNDNIAIANLTDALGFYGIRTRFVDMQTMTMFNSQEFPIPEKTEVVDMVYSKIPKTLLMLSHFDFLGSNNDDYVFLRINPFAINPYPATGIVDTSMNYYSSMDVLGQSYFIATGGNYGFIKHVTLDIPTTLCYMNNTIHMEILPNITITPNTFSYDIVPWNITPTSHAISFMAVPHSIGCVQY